MKEIYFLFLRLLVILEVILLNQHVAAQQPKIKTPQIIKVSANANLDSLKVEQLIQEGKKYGSNLDKKAPSYYLQALKIADAQKKINPKHQELILYPLGVYYATKGSYDSAKYYYGKLQQSGITYKNQLAIVKANIGLGIVADYQADYETAISKNMLALKYAELVLDSSAIAACNGNIANSYLRLKQYKKAIPMLNTAIEIYTKRGQLTAVANNLSSLARAYKGLGDKKTELELKLKAFSMFKAANYKKGMATVSINLGVYYYGQNNIREAKKYYAIALKNLREINDKGNIAILYNNMSDLYLSTNQLDSAKITTDSAYYYASKSGDKLSQFDALLSNSNILHALGKHKEADTFLNRYIALKDSVYNDKMRSQVAEMEVKYDTEKKESKIALLNRENSLNALILLNKELELGKNKSLIDQQRQELTINQLELTNKDQILVNQKLDSEKKAQNIKALQKQTQIQTLEIANRKLEVQQRNLAIALLLIGILTAAGIFYAFYHRYKFKKETQLQAEIYKQQEIATKSIFEGEQKERIRIARDLHDGIGQMLSVVKMNVSTFDERDKIVNGTMQLVDKTITEVRNISHNLIPEALNFGLFSALEEVCNKINDAGKTTAKLNISDEASSKKLSKQNELSIYRIVQEVLSNMVKHANAKHIDIDITQRDHRMMIGIKDDGRGFDTDTIEASKGIGWKNISARVHLLDGEMKVASERLIGTHIEISIPE